MLQETYIIKNINIALQILGNVLKTRSYPSLSYILKV